MNKKIFTISLFVISVLIIVSCKSIGIFNDFKKNTDYSLYGEWKTTCYDNINDIRLIFLKNGDYYKFSRFNGGSLILEGKVHNNDSLLYVYSNNIQVWYRISFNDTIL